MDRVLVAVENMINYKLIENLLKKYYSLFRYEEDMDIPAKYDLIIADGLMLSSISVLIQKSLPRLFLPVLLITPKEEVSLLTNDIWRSVDDVLTTPIIKKELFARVEMLLRTRRQAIKLNEKNVLLNEEKASLVYEHRSLIDSLSNISHELRTPLSVILSGIDYLSASLAINKADPDIYKQTLDIAKKNSFRLLRIINNMLDLTRIDAGKMTLNLQNINLYHFLEQIVQSVCSYALQKGIKLKFVSTTKKKITAVDAQMLDRIMLNLLSNAIKFSDKNGCISVSLRSSHNKSMIIVKDNGIGIAREKQAQIFDRFVQADEASNKHTDGCGLGLSLVKTMVEMHGGTVNVQSRPGFGSQFCIELPDKMIDCHSESFVYNQWSDLVCCELSEI